MKQNLFSEEELKEIDLLSLHGGVGVSPLMQGNCSNDDCITLNEGCVNQGCIAQSKCSDSADSNCVNQSCWVPNIGCIVMPQSGCACSVIV